MAEMRAAHLEPLEPYQGMHSPWLCRCTLPGCGAICSPRLASIRAGQGGCRSCAEWGFNWNAPAVIYIITHLAFGAHKVGVTGADTDRLAAFQRLGWQVHHEAPMPTGAAAYTVEQALHKRLREIGIPGAFLSRNNLAKLGGYSETIDAKAISLSDLERFVHEEISKHYNDPEP
ncbi:hypothetical protein [Microbispora rosea]|uniref:hypothetical protein n=1 Tax=Microbispora rosea TaxID=58117 RepID=UPI00342CF144